MSNRKEKSRLEDDISECLDSIFGDEGDSMIGKSPRDILAKISEFIYPCPTLAELDTYLRVLPSVIIADSDNRDIGVLEKFRITRNQVNCDVRKLDVRKIDPRILEGYKTFAVRCAIEGYLFAMKPNVPHHFTEC